MTKVKVEPGPCGFKTIVTAEADEDEPTEIKVKVACGCEAVQNMMVLFT